MKIALRLLLLISLLLSVASWATCRFGVQHEINKIPPEVRSRMTDTDWVGVEWIGRGMLMQGIALGLLVMAGAGWIMRHKRTGVNSVSR